MTYDVRINLTIEADSEKDALEMAAACVSNADEDGNFDHVQGVGGAKGSIDVRERKR